LNTQGIIQHRRRSHLGTGTWPLNQQRLFGIAIRPDRNPIIGATTTCQRMLGRQCLQPHGGQSIGLQACNKT